MRKRFSVLAAAGLALGLSAPAHAAPVLATGSIDIVIGTLPGLSLPIPSTQVDVTGNTLTIPAGIASTSGLFVSVTGFPLNLITGIVVTASNQAGSFTAGNAADGGAATIPGGGFGGKMPLQGVVQVKGSLAINVPISNIGAGGSVNAGGIVVEGAPWTTGVAKVTTDGAPAAMFQQAGSLQGQLGATSSSISLVTPAHVNASGLARLPVFTVMNLHFGVIPEPGTALLLGAGIAGLVAIGRRKGH